jgi:multidrug resistance efflux pump
LKEPRPAEIARMEGVKHPSGVRGMIIRVSDQLRCGEISLFELDHEEAEAAKARLEAKRAKRRERHAKNKDRINAQRRETFALKKSTEP